MTNAPPPARLFRSPGQPIASEIDLDAEGKHVGVLRLPHSVHRSAYGWLPIPIASIKSGPGPVVIVAAGNHGDEYEGQLIVSRLIREVTPDQVTGQLILLPMANAPAARAGTRTSPLDEGNLNRLFPGDPAGTPTQVIAHYLEKALFARSDLILDLHSGGSSLYYEGANVIVGGPRDDAEAAHLTRLLTAFGGVRTYYRQTPSGQTTIGAARRQGSISIVAELGGAGAVTPQALRDGWQSVCNTLGEIGLLHGGLVPAGPPHATQFMQIDFDSPDFYPHAHCDGVFEPLVEVGEAVRPGQPIARIHFPATPQREPETVYAAIDAIAVCKRAMAPVQHGDCLYQLAQPLARG